MIIILALRTVLPITRFFPYRRLFCSILMVIVTFRGLAPYRKKTEENCLNARSKMTSDKFDDERLLARKTNEKKMKNG